jgi:tellurite resistance protein TerC
MWMDALFATLAVDFAGSPVWFWVVFGASVTTLLALDLGVLQRDTRPMDVPRSLRLSAFYIACGLGFGVWVWAMRGSEAGITYITGFLVEKSLSLDNVFVISLIFAALTIPPQYQRRVLFWGVLGAIVMRLVMIALGAALVSSFAWVLPLFAVFLIFTGAKMLLTKSEHGDPADSRTLAFLRRRLPVTPTLQGERFFVRGGTKLMVTPLFLALSMVEVADLVFAVDSVPAIFAITSDPFIVATSNIFAILGLRALYFALAAMVERFQALKPALALVLVFIGGKIIWGTMFGHVPALLSLGVTLALLGGGIVASLLRPARA